jgi:hypothetical protein
MEIPTIGYIERTYNADRLHMTHHGCQRTNIDHLSMPYNRQKQFSRNAVNQLQTRLLTAGFLNVGHYGAPLSPRMIAPQVSPRSLAVKARFHDTGTKCIKSSKCKSDYILGDLTRTEHTNKGIKRYRLSSKHFLMIPTTPVANLNKYSILQLRTPTA